MQYEILTAITLLSRRSNQDKVRNSTAPRL
ncbi:unnamed protein product [Gulo gulo]|uniref:Uncharacterized protein n=1 Tax=Gulo gulo TaxID=48420 RepID=A0A9X9Q233_GULGU|nr:unnamed protein product [Gulo gulo]